MPDLRLVTSSLDEQIETKVADLRRTWAAIGAAQILFETERDDTDRFNLCRKIEVAATELSMIADDLALLVEHREESHTMLGELAPQDAGRSHDHGPATENDVRDETPRDTSASSPSIAATIIREAIAATCEGAPSMAAGFRLAGECLADPELLALVETDPVAAQREIVRRAKGRP